MLKKKISAVSIVSPKMQFLLSLFFFAMAKEKRKKVKNKREKQLIISPYFFTIAFE